MCGSWVSHLTCDVCTSRLSVKELLGYDAPATIDVEFVTGKKKRFLAEHYTRREMQDIVDQWQFEAHLQFMKDTAPRAGQALMNKSQSRLATCGTVQCSNRSASWTELALVRV